MGIARLPAATKAGVRSCLLSWVRSCMTSTSKWRKKPGKSSSSIGKMLRGGSDSPALTVFWLQSVGKRNEKNNLKRFAGPADFLKSFAPLGAVAHCWKNRGMYLHPTPGLLTVQWWLEGFRLDFPSCKASHYLDLRDNFFCPSVKQLH